MDSADADAPAAGFPAAQGSSAQSPAGSLSRVVGGLDLSRRTPAGQDYAARVVETIVRAIAPHRALDVGCGAGLIVEAFWDRGIEAYGVHADACAVAATRADMRAYCSAQPLTQPFQARYDLIVCLDVVERLRPEDAEIVVRNIAQAADAVLFSSPQSGEPGTSGRPTLAWIKLFGGWGLWPDLLHDASYAAPSAMLLRRRDKLPDDVLVLFASRISLQGKVSDGLRRLDAVRAEDASARRAAATVVQSLRSAKASLERALGETTMAESSARSAAKLAQAARQKGREAALATLRRMRGEITGQSGETASVLAHLSLADASGRLAGRLRALAGRYPESIRRRLRRATKLSWWIAAPHKTAQRMRFLRQRNAGATPVLSSPTAPEPSAAFAGIEAPAPQSDRNLVAQSRLFDAAWYVEAYADVKSNGLDPVSHYLDHGAAEGRDPGPRFSTLGYVNKYPEVANSPRNPLAHFEDVGRRAGYRAIASTHRLASAQVEDDPATRRRVQYYLIAASPLFDAGWYTETYPDVDERGLDPVAHYLDAGAAEGRDPGPDFSTSAYLERYPSVTLAGANALAHYEEHVAELDLIVSPSTQAPRLSQAAGKGATGASGVLDEAFTQSAPLQVFLIGRALRPRVTMLTDSIGASSFFGGVGTAAIFSALLARRRGAGLRIATMQEEPVRESVATLLGCNGVAAPEHIEFTRASRLRSGVRLDVSDEDLFVTTSWWSTRSLLASVAPERIVYLAQEDERMFYPGSDTQLRAMETMVAPGLRCVVNTKLLYDYLTSTGFDALQKTGTWFEPAFPASAYFYEPSERQPLNFFFYARPNNARNLYYRGLEAIEQAVAGKILARERWRIHFVGSRLPDIRLSDGVEAIVVHGLSWEAYAAFMRQMDLGLSLMFTPHPSYPPLDLAAAGAVAVTNSFGPKQSLSSYSENILCVDPSVDALVGALEQGANLARNRERRAAHYARQGLLRSWQTAFEPCLRWLES